MAGLTATNRKQFHELLTLRRRLTFRQFKRRPGEMVAGIIIAIFTIPIPLIMGVVSTAATVRTPMDGENTLVAMSSPIGLDDHV